MTITPLPKTFVEKPWGRTDLPLGFAADGRRIGEVWFDRDAAPLPVLVKWLFTSERLSVQVHPNDEQAQARGLTSGKEECWFVIDAQPGATLGIGTIQPLSPDELRAAAQSGEIEQLLDWKPVASGDWFHIPPGTVHAIGAGVTLVEVQQNADITYRLYDYGRPRELHLEDGVEVSDARPFAGAQGHLRDVTCGQTILSTPHFRVSKLCHEHRGAKSQAPHSLIVPIVAAPRMACGAFPLGDVFFAEDGQMPGLDIGGVALKIEWG